MEILMKKKFCVINDEATIVCQGLAGDSVRTDHKWIQDELLKDGKGIITISTEIEKLKKYRKFLRDAETYHIENEQEILMGMQIEREENTKRKMLELLNNGHMVWCRNGTICKNVTPCGFLECCHKKKKPYIVSGCSKCQTFQITTISAEWETAIHVGLEEAYYARNRN